MSGSCEYYQELMSRMLDGGLMDAEAAALREHIRGCRDCRGMCAAFSSMALSLRDDLAEPPAGLSSGVMARIRAEEARKAAPAPETETELSPDRPEPEPAPPRAARPRRKAVRLWPKLAAAACLVVIVGSGLFASLRRGASGGTAADSAVLESFSLAAADAEEAAIEEAQQEAAYDVSMSAALDTDGAEESAVMEDAASSPGFDLANPAQVPEGREVDFEALLEDAGWPDGTAQETWQAIYAVEYNGVIYEFLTDSGERYLLWRDAAEGLPVLSPGTVADLWEIFE